MLAGERSWKVLDLFALQGMLAHRSGNWFDRMRLELRRIRDNPEVANAVFDGYLCAAEYLLYGPTPYGEVIAVARDLQATARRSGALRAAAFASALIGEAALLSGDLELAGGRADRGAATSTATSARRAARPTRLQRLAEVRVAEGDGAAAQRLLQQALPLARSSLIAKHLLQRIFGTHDPGRRRSPRGPGRRRPGRVHARLGRRLPVLLDHAARCRRPSPACGRATSWAPAVTSRSPSARPSCGTARRGRPGWPRPRRPWPRPAAISPRPASASARPPSGSTGPANPSTPSAAAASWPTLLTPGLRRSVTLVVGWRPRA